MPPLRSISHPVICAPSELVTSLGRRRRWLGRKSVADRGRSSNARLTGSRIPGGILARAPYVARAFPRAPSTSVKSRDSRVLRYGTLVSTPLSPPRAEVAPSPRELSPRGLESRKLDPSSTATNVEIFRRFNYLRNSKIVVRGSRLPYLPIAARSVASIVLATHSQATG